jgi:hypothetical protein
MYELSNYSFITVFMAEYAVSVTLLNVIRRCQGFNDTSDLRCNSNISYHDVRYDCAVSMILLIYSILHQQCQLPCLTEVPLTELPCMISFKLNITGAL